jgi:hypothetical protein
MVTGFPVAVMFHWKPVVGFSGNDIWKDSPAGISTDSPLLEDVNSVICVAPPILLPISDAEWS